jgi:FixJ family two-component response regulator
MKMEDHAELLAIIDDDLSFRKSMQDLIEAEGMSALCFDSAEQFLGSKARFTTACLIADIRMPGISGLSQSSLLTGPGTRREILGF